MRAVESLQESAQTTGVPEQMIFGLALALEVLLAVVIPCVRAVVSRG